ncbi:MAG: MBL fold metallo-hydrolase [Geminicoccaceae bacterium]|nr:MBL fold metallo-hydrolase [Geminicoccaceae bacterium]
MVDYEVLIQGNNLAYADGALGISSVVLITTDEGPLLFDTGHYGNRPGLLRALARRGLRPADVPRVFLSHLHWDHSLNVDLFEHAEIIVSRRELDYARSPHPDDVYLPWGILEQLGKHRVTVLERASELGGGLHAFPAPGHTPGHYALAFDHDLHRRVVVAGDAIKYPKEVMTGTPDLVFDTVERGQETITDILERADRIIPGHFVELRLERAGWVWDDAAPFDLRVR